MKVEITMSVRYNPEVNDELWNTIKDLEEPELLDIGDELIEKFGLRDVTRALTILATLHEDGDASADVTKYLDILVDRVVDNIVDQGASELDFDSEVSDKAFAEGVAAAFDAFKEDLPMEDD